MKKAIAFPGLILTASTIAGYLENTLTTTPYPPPATIIPEPRGGYL